ncbi:MAG: NTP transferase domain-containing protein [Fimbriimonadaceae bacterium]|nr:NTP transferase domain-containing protein [Fimbriimonadaceae bacterium]
MRWGVVVAAGGHADPDLAHAMGTTRKALARFGEVTSLELTLDAVRQTGFDACVTVSGLDVQHAVSHGEFLPEGQSAIDNARLGLEALGSEVEAVLFIPADSPLLDAEMLTSFTGAVAKRASLERWYSTGLSPLEGFRASFPEAETQALKLREGKYLSGALYAASPAGLIHALDLLTAMRRNRKSQAAMAWKLGPVNLARYVLGRISLADAERIVGKALGGQAVIVPDAHPATCLDFDTVADFEAIQRILRSD